MSNSIVSPIEQLQRIRSKIQNEGKSKFLEFAMYVDDPDFKEMLDDLNATFKRMNDEKLKALNDIQKKYQDEIDEMIQCYTVQLEMRASR